MQVKTRVPEAKGDKGTGLRYQQMPQDQNQPFYHLPSRQPPPKCHTELVCSPWVTVDGIMAFTLRVPMWFQLSGLSQARDCVLQIRTMALKCQQNPDSMEAC